MSRPLLFRFDFGDDESVFTVSSVYLIARQGMRPWHARAPRGRGSTLSMEGCWSAQPDAAPAGGDFEAASTRVFFGLCCGASSLTSRHFAGGSSSFSSLACHSFYRLSRCQFIEPAFSSISLLSTSLSAFMLVSRSFNLHLTVYHCLVSSFFCNVLLLLLFLISLPIVVSLHSSSS